MAERADTQSEVSIATSASAYEQREHFDLYTRDYMFKDQLMPVALRFLWSMGEESAPDEVGPVIRALCARFGTQVGSVATAGRRGAMINACEPSTTDQVSAAAQNVDDSEIDLVKWFREHPLHTANTPSAVHLPETKIRDAFIDYVLGCVEQEQDESSARRARWCVQACSYGVSSLMCSIAHVVSSSLDGFWALSDALTRYENPAELSPRQETRLNTEINSLQTSIEKLQASLAEMEETFNDEIRQWQSRCEALNTECERLRGQRRIEDWVARTLPDTGSCSTGSRGKENHAQD